MDLSFRESKREASQSVEPDKANFFPFELILAIISFQEKDPEIEEAKKKKKQKTEVNILARS